LRIISGKYKGQLVSFKADHIRPTTDRVKESQFNILQGAFEDARVLDLFAGTGSLGIEALSRGAREVVFVEQNAKSIAIIKKNLEKLKVIEPCQIIAKDVLKFLKAYDGEPFDVIFVDPPFTEAMADAVMLAASTSKISHSGTILTIESGRREKITDDYSTFIRYDVREFGDKFLSFFQRAKTTPETASE
jgi:16S rRNA (guanine966-N2)-methyltransferase